MLLFRCVVCRDGKALEMSLDHKPEDDIELERIKVTTNHIRPFVDWAKTVSH